MKKISLKATIAAVSLSLALTPLGFAQSPAGTPAATKAQTQTAADTQPLPGARLASQFVEASGALTPLGVAAVAALAAIGVAVAVSNNNNNDDATNAAILAALQKNNVTTTR